MPKLDRALLLRSVPVLCAATIAVSASSCGEASQQPSGNGGPSDGATSMSSDTTQMADGAGTYSMAGSEVFPEGVAYGEETGDFFVGSTTDGTVFRGNVEDGPSEMEVFLQPGGNGRETAVGMKTDGGRLYIAGGETGRAWVYDTGNGEFVRSYGTPDSGTTFINDVAITPDGDAYFTDSMRPVLFRIPAGSTEARMEPWLDLEGTPIEYGEGFNLNGIAPTADGRFLITVKSDTGQLFRIDTESREVVEIDLGGRTLTNGDGILLRDRTLYVVRNQQGLIVPVELDGSFASGEVGEPFSDPSFRYPTTIAGYRDRLLVVNSQFDQQGQGGDPELPFTVSETPIP